MSSEPEPLSPIKRFITTHDENGNAIWDDTIPDQVQSNRNGGSTTHVSWLNEDSSNTLTGNNDLKSYRENPSEKDIAPASGSSLRVVDFWPGFPAIMHRTASVDYGIVMEGEIDCILDNGATKTFRRGDIIIQRGTNHAWKNKGTDVARIYFTLLPSPPVKIQGKELEVHGFADLGRLAEEPTV
ncbi:cupin [Fusarium heterosporum]|uniref:Cupin n=1 Tax=Fusarium heterosporum TaxID=42747 RepID=A0A8H5SQ69_FUSHE|nr:cupin [Fusarium heterosporum]